MKKIVQLLFDQKKHFIFLRQNFYL